MGLHKWMGDDMNNDQLYFYNRGFNDCLAKCLDASPVKTLTDEEILEQALFNFGNETENFDDSYWIGFARAILKKASEK